MTQTNDRPTAIDLFCGAGGASLAIHNAGYNLTAAVDTDTVALDTHSRNLASDTVQHDLSDVNVSVLPDSAQSPDYVHGSPPCRGFSKANNDRSVTDTRNGLVFDFVEWVRQLAPAVVTLENVTGMLTISPDFIDGVVTAFTDCGYTVRWRVLNAADYGVPQTRKRVFTVAVRDDVTMPSRWFPQPTHARSETQTLDGQTLSPWLTVDSAIGDLCDSPATKTQGVTSSSTWKGPQDTAGTVLGTGNYVRCGSDSDPRRASVRECARLQTFPDHYSFAGTKSDQYQQVGDAVPPLLQRQIAGHVQEVC
jgi:DNA (cytosine-5)-methyltransferase 1